MKNGIYVFLLLLFSTLSCNRISEDITSQKEDSDQLVQEAKSFFLNNYSSHQSARSGAGIDKQLQWNKAITFSFKGKEIVEVPILFNGKDPIYKVRTSIFGSKGNTVEGNGVTKAIFFKHKDKSITLYVMQLVMDQDYYTAQKATQQYKQLTLNSLSKDFSGHVFFADWDNNLIDKYRYENGKVIALDKKYSSTDKKARLQSCTTHTECGSFHVQVYFGCCDEETYSYGGPYCACCENQPAPTWYDQPTGCYEVTDFCDPDPVDEPGNGTNPGNSNPTTTVDIDITNLHTPCMIGAYNSLVDTEIKSKVINIIQGFQKSGNVIIEIVDRDFGNTNVDGETRVTNAANNVYEIALNTAALSNASKDYIAATIIHEMIHVYLPANDGTTDHETMATQYVNPMANALKAAGYALTYSDAVDLSWGGLQKTKAWTELKNIDTVTGSQVTNRILQTNSNFKNATGYGVRCN